MILNTNFYQRFFSYAERFEKVLLDYISKLNLKPNVLQESVKYSLQVGGKRIRPVLMFATAEMIGLNIEEIEKFALAIELIHTYSLIHDDLPSMDNDDFRRGKPSNHKVFGEANAILAGDSLLNEGYNLCFEQCFKGENYIKASKLICSNAGVYGMIAGQSADLFYEGDNEVDEQILSFIIENKTAKMIQSSIIVPALIANLNEETIKNLDIYAKNLGILFQITDDVLDVTGNFEDLGKTVGKDEHSDKLSSVKVYGLENCKKKICEYKSFSIETLKKLPFDSSFLESFTNYVCERKK